MSDPNRTNHQTEAGLPNSLYGSPMGLNPSSMAMSFMNNNVMNPNYQFLMRLSEMSGKPQAGNISMGYNNVPHSNFLQPPMTNLSPALANTANAELMNSFNWATALQYTQMLNGAGCGSLNNLESSAWNPLVNNDQAWKAIQSLYLDFYNPVASNPITNNHNFQTPINMHPYPQCDSQESFNDVLAKLGHGLNAAKKREEEGLPDLIKDPIIQSSIGNKIYDSNIDRGAVVTSSYDPNQSDFSYDIPLGLQNSYYSKSQNMDFSRNSSPAFNRSTSSNQGRGRGRPPKSTLSRSQPSTLDYKGDQLNYMNVFENPSSVPVSLPSVASYGDPGPNSSPSYVPTSVNKGGSAYVTSHVSSKLVIPPTISSVTKAKLNVDCSDTESKTSTHTMRKSKEESGHKVHSKKTSSTSSIEGTIDDVLKSFQGIHTMSMNSMSSSLLTSLSKTVAEVPSAEDLTNGKKRTSKNPIINDKHERFREQTASVNYVKPLNNGWSRKTYLKSLTELIGDVEYESPSGLRLSSLAIIKEVLVKEKISNLTIENFSFDITLRLGDYLKPSFNHIMGFEKLSTTEVELLFDRRTNIQDQSHMVTTKEESKKSSHGHRKMEWKAAKSALRTEKDLLKDKKEQKLIETHISKELKKPVDDLRLLNNQPLPNFDEIQGNRLSKKSFSDCLLVSEFLYSFAEVLGIDAETIPTMNDYQKAFVDRNPESLHIICWLLMELLKFAVCDPGITNTKLITQVIGVKFSDLEVNLNTLTGVLRAFILARAIGSESEMESWLVNTDYKELSGEHQATLLSFVVNEMLSSRLISCEVDKILDQQSFIRKDKWILDGKLRRLKLIQSRKICCSNGGGAIANNNCGEGAPLLLDPDCSISAIEGDSDVDSIDSNENMTGSQMNWSGEEEETASSSSLEDIEKHIDKLNNQVVQKKHDLNQCDHRLRGIFLGQDRFHRSYYLLRHLGGIYVDAAPESLRMSMDPDSIVETIKSMHSDTRIKIECFEDDKLMVTSLDPNRPGSHFMPLLPQLANEDTVLSSVKLESSFSNEMPNLNPQVEPLDLRLTGGSDDRRYEMPSIEAPYKMTKYGKNAKSSKVDWDLDVIDSATTLYANRAQYIYPEIEFEQLKQYYRQQLEDYLRECNQENSMEHLKSWISFYQMVLKNERTNGEVVHSSTKTNQTNTKSDRIKEMADKELQKIGKQTVSNNQTIPNELKNNWRWIRDEETLKTLVASFHSRGLRERNLAKTINRNYDLILSTFKQDISLAFNYDSQRCPAKLKVQSKRGKGRGNSHNHLPIPKISLGQSLTTQLKLEPCEQNDTFLAEVSALEKVEDLISTVVNASLFKKGWKYPERVISDDTIKVIPSTVPKQFNFEMYPLDLGKERLLELEDQLERRYLLPPLNWKFKPKLSMSNKDLNLKKTLDEVVSSSCGFEDAADSSSSFVDDNRSLSPILNRPNVDTDGKDFKNLKSENCELIETPPGLVSWRKLVLEGSNDQHLLNCMHTLSNAIAWDKSIMKVLCQICRKDCNEAQLLLCDSCDQGYHTYCFRPPLACIPDGQWFCHDCVSKASDQKHCYVCGQPKTARTMVCGGCKRMLHAACAKPIMTRVPRKWTCHNCSGKVSSDDGISCTSGKNFSTLTICLNNYAESNSCPNSNSSTANSDTNLHCKLSSSSSISSNNILTKKRSCKRVLEPQTTSTMAKKRTKRSTIDIKPNRLFPPDCLRLNKDTSSLKDEKSSIADLFDVDNLKTLIGDLSLVPPDQSTINQVDFDFCRQFLLAILDQEFVHPFLSPVDLRKVPIYKKVIRSPMDLGTIARKLSEFAYANAEEFSKDIKLIFTNCEQFNEDNSEIGIAGHSLRLYFQENWNMPLLVAEAAESIAVTDM